MNRAQLTLSLSSSPSEASNEGRDEVLHCLRASDKHKHEALSPDPPVADCHLEGRPMRNVFDAAALRKTDAICRQPVACEYALFFFEEAACARGVVGHKEVDGDCGNNGCESFQDLSWNQQCRSYAWFKEAYEKPSPSGKASCTVQISGDHTSEKARYRSSNRD